MANRGHVEAGGNNLAIAPGNHLAHFLGPLVDEQNQQCRLWMIDRDAFDDCLEEHRLSGAGRRDNQCALSVTDWCDEVDGAARQLRSTFGRSARLELELALRVRRNERCEIGTTSGRRRIFIVDFLDVDDDYAVAMIVAGGGEHLVATA